jgi:hypothetical protein
VAGASVFSIVSLGAAGADNDRLLKHYDISFVSTGDVLRNEIANKTDIGRRAEDIVKSGGGCNLPLTEHPGRDSSLSHTMLVSRWSYWSSVPVKYG